MSMPSIQPIISVETIPFPGYDGTQVGSVALTKKTEGKSALSAFNNAENFLYRMHKTVVNDMKKENPSEEEGGEKAKKQDYKDMFQDWTKEHEKTEIVRATGGKKIKRKTKKTKSKKAKKRSRRTKINKK
jgi:hypothetical protein